MAAAGVVDEDFCGAEMHRMAVGDAAEHFLHSHLQICESKS